MSQPILIAEDNEDDVFVLLRAFHHAQISNPVVTVVNGDEVLDYLTGKGAYADRDAHPLPGIIFLDMKMPKMDGFQVLEWIGRNKEFQNIPVVVLTGSMALSDANRAYKLGATSFIAKPCKVEHIEALPAMAKDALSFGQVVGK